MVSSRHILKFSTASKLPFRGRELDHRQLLDGNVWRIFRTKILACLKLLTYIFSVKFLCFLYFLISFPLFLSINPQINLQSFRKKTSIVSFHKTSHQTSLKQQPYPPYPVPRCDVLCAPCALCAVCPLRCAVWSNGRPVVEDPPTSGTTQRTWKIYKNIPSVK